MRTVITLTVLLLIGSIGTMTVIATISTFAEHRLEAVGQILGRH
jgi:hypothetical protein